MFCGKRAAAKLGGESGQACPLRTEQPREILLRQEHLVCAAAFCACISRRLSRCMMRCLALHMAVWHMAVCCACASKSCSQAKSGDRAVSSRHAISTSSPAGFLEVSRDRRASRGKPFRSRQ